MTRTAVIIGSSSSEIASGAPTLPISDRGAIALAMARFGGNVCAYAADADAGCFARAAGVERVEEISIQEIDGVVLDSIGVALIGRGGCGEFGDALPARLAEQSGAALIFDVIDVQPKGDRLAVTRDLGRGARDLLSVRGRAVLVVADSVVRGPYVSRHRMNAQRTVGVESAARNEPSDAKSSLQEEPNGGESDFRREPSRVEWQSATPRVRLGDHASRVSGRAAERMNALLGVGGASEKTASLVRGSAEECARHLLRYLSHHGFVERATVADSQRASDGAVASRPAERQPPQSASETASVPARVQRRPHLLKGRPLASRGPFELGVDT